VKVEIPAFANAQNKLVIEDNDKAEALAQQFSSVFICSDNPHDRVPMEDKEIIAHEVNIRWLLKIISSMPNSKAVGADGIPMQLLRKCSLVTAPCLAVLANRCIAEGIFPTIWKKATVIPVPKVRSPMKSEDFWPISLLSIASKIVESCIAKLLQPYMEKFLSQNQYGFRQKRSTVEAILNLQHLVMKGFEQCEKQNKASRVCAVFFDVAKAFDTVQRSYTSPGMEIQTAIELDISD
jgi:hypothetical protein